MHQFLERDNLKKLTQEVIYSLNRPIPIKEINLSKQKELGTVAFIGELSKTFFFILVSFIFIF